ncbi:hypothetical protein GCM10009531_21550 [Actinoplanes capillaceus]
MTFGEAYQQVPVDGVGHLKIHWDVPSETDVDEVLAARRALTHVYWGSQATDWTPIMATARFLFTDEYYQRVLAGLGASGAGDPMIGPIWVKLMGVERLGPDQARVTFCTDIGWWREASDSTLQVRKDRANLESFVMRNVPTGDGEQHWLADQHWNPDADRRAKYGAVCTRWAQHQP